MLLYIKKPLLHTLLLHAFKILESFQCILKNFPKFTRKETLHRYFPVNFVKCFKNAFSAEHLWTTTFFTYQKILLHK